jgi:hypothetical protein
MIVSINSKEILLFQRSATKNSSTETAFDVKPYVSSNCYLIIKDAQDLCLSKACNKWNCDNGVGGQCTAGNLIYCKNVYSDCQFVWSRQYCLSVLVGKFCAQSDLKKVSDKLDIIQKEYEAGKCKNYPKQVKNLSSRKSIEFLILIIILSLNFISKLF